MTAQPEAVNERSAMDARRRAKMRIGSLVFAALIVLDLIEYAVAQVAGHLLLWMTLLAIPQAGLIVLFYMHFRQLWREDD